MKRLLCYDMGRLISRERCYLVKYVNEAYDFVGHAWSRSRIQKLIAPLESLAYCTTVKGFREVGRGIQPEDETYFNFFQPRGSFHDSLYGDDFPAEDLVNDCICEAVKQYIQNADSDYEVPFVRILIDLMSNPRFTYLGDGRKGDGRKYVHVIPGNSSSYLLAANGAVLADFHFGSKDDAGSGCRASFTDEEISEMRAMDGLAIDWTKVNYE